MKKTIDRVSQAIIQKTIDRVSQAITQKTIDRVCRAIIQKTIDRMTNQGAIINKIIAKKGRNQAFIMNKTMKAITVRKRCQCLKMYQQIYHSTRNGQSFI